MLAAYIPVPAIGIGVLIGTAGSWWKRIGRGVAFGVSAIVCSLPWMVVVDLWDKSARPYIGGSTDNTVWDLVFGYNGFGRVDGNGQGGGGLGGGGLAGPGGVFGGSPGTFRLWNDAVGGQIAWLIPLGVAAAVAGVWLHRRHRARLAGVVMFAMWAAICGAVFSYAKGTFHSYYTSELAPGLAATIGIGGVALARLLKQNRAWLAVVAGALVVTVVVQLDLIGRTPEFFGWTEWPLLVVAVVATCLFVAAIVLRRGRSVLIASGLALALGGDAADAGGVGVQRGVERDPQRHAAPGGSEDGHRRRRHSAAGSSRIPRTAIWARSCARGTPASTGISSCRARCRRRTSSRPKTSPSWRSAASSAAIPPPPSTPSPTS